MTMLNFSSKITHTVLGYYFSQPTAAHYLNELADLLSLDPGNLHRKMKELEDEGIFLSEPKGNLRYYRLNRGNSLLKQYRELFESRYGLKEQIKKALSGISGLESVWLYGSIASQKAGPQSDIDLLLVGRHSAIAVRRALEPLQKRLGREINTVDYNPAEFARAQKDKDPFVKNALAGPAIKLI